MATAPNDETEVETTREAITFKLPRDLEVAA